jgi:hypothetical protein
MLWLHAWGEKNKKGLGEKKKESECFSGVGLGVLGLLR